MKQFLYCETTDGGMAEYFVPSAEGLRGLYGWMHGDCAVEDKLLSLWMVTAEVGDYRPHRLGACVRLKDVAR